MKIAIYGDSFGDFSLENIPGDDLDRGKAWVELFAENHEVTNFSASGSSLFYSYDLFCKHNKEFDYNIFLVTESNRITINSPYERLTHININSINFYRNTNLNPEEKKIIDAIENYYSIVHNQDYVNTCHRLMVDSLITINPNTIIIPVFGESLMGSYLNSLIFLSDWELCHITGKLNNKNYIQWKLIGDTGWSFVDYKKCHLTEENNKILYDKLIECINNKFTGLLNISINDFKQSHKDFEFYFRKVFYTDTGAIYTRFNGELRNLCNTLLIDTN